ncbi:MAG: hypothetical protein ACRBK7_10775 [Acidimicrobiales bacterium]
MKIEEQLAGEHEGIQIQAVFVAVDQPPDESALDGFAGIEQIPFIGIVVGVVVFVVEIWRWVRAGRKAPRRSYLMAVTSEGLAVGELSWSTRSRIREWAVSPSAGLRYELDPSSAAAAADLVELKVAGQSYWAVGPERDIAYRFYRTQ